MGHFAVTFQAFIDWGFQNYIAEDSPSYGAHWSVGTPQAASSKIGGFGPDSKHAHPALKVPLMLRLWTGSNEIEEWAFFRAMKQLILVRPVRARNTSGRSVCGTSALKTLVRL